MANVWDGKGELRMHIIRSNGVTVPDFPATDAVKIHQISKRFESKGVALHSIPSDNFAALLSFAVLLNANCPIEDYIVSSSEVAIERVTVIATLWSFSSHFPNKLYFNWNLPSWLRVGSTCQKSFLSS